jgi:elongation factor Ts
MNITIERIKELRDQSGAGIMECRNALIEATGDMEKALEILKQQSLFKAEKKKARSATQGLVETYIHTGGRIGAMVEVNCESDFVARTDEFKGLAHDLAMQVAAQDPRFISREQIPEGADVEPEAACLLLQPFIKNPEQTIQDLITQTVARVGENIRVSRFARFELGQAESILAESESGNSADE